MHKHIEKYVNKNSYDWIWNYQTWTNAAKKKRTHPDIPDHSLTLHCVSDVMTRPGLHHVPQPHHVSGYFWDFKTGGSGAGLSPKQPVPTSEYSAKPYSRHLRLLYARRTQTVLTAALPFAVTCTSLWASTRPLPLDTSCWSLPSTLFHPHSSLSSFMHETRMDQVWPRGLCNNLSTWEKHSAKPMLQTNLSRGCRGRILSRPEYSDQAISRVKIAW